MASGNGFCILVVAGGRTGGSLRLLVCVPLADARVAQRVDGSAEPRLSETLRFIRSEIICDQEILCLRRMHEKAMAANGPTEKPQSFDTPKLCATCFVEEGTEGFVYWLHLASGYGKVSIGPLIILGYGASHLGSCF